MKDSFTIESIEPFRQMPYKSTEQNAIAPDHVAIIMDGNGRWATSQGKARFAGHRAGTIHINDIVRAFADHGV